MAAFDEVDPDILGLASPQDRGDFCGMVVETFVPTRYPKLNITFLH